MFGKGHFSYTYTHDFHINVDIILTGEMQNDLKVNNHYFHSSGVF